MKYPYIETPTEFDVRAAEKHYVQIRDRFVSQQKGGWQGLLKAGFWVEAIKEYRRANKCGLAAAHAIINWEMK